MPPAFQAFRPPCKDSLTTWKYSWFSLSILSCPHAGAAVISYLEHDVFEGFLVSYNGLTDHRAQALQEVNLRSNEEGGM